MPAARKLRHAPSLFLSHASPLQPLNEAPARGFLQELGARLERPGARPAVDKGPSTTRAHRDLVLFAAKSHPTEEHLSPLSVARRAAGEHARPERSHADADQGVLRMDVHGFRGRVAGPMKREEHVAHG